MRLSIGWSASEKQRWDTFWYGLADIGELGPRESRLVASTARQGITENFEHERSPDGTPWHPLSPRTVKERRSGIDSRGVPFRTGGHHPILQRTGDLKRSFVDPTHPRNVTQIERGGGITALVLSAVDDPRTPNRIATLNSGGLTLSNSIVLPRPFVGLSDASMGRLGEQVERILWQRVERL